MFFNVDVQVTEDVWFKLFLGDKETLTPFSRAMKAELSYNGRDIKIGLNLGEPSTNAHEYDGNIYFQWASNKMARTKFSIKKTNSNVHEYEFTSSTEIPQFEKLDLKGKVVRSDLSPSANFEWNYGSNKYSASIQYQTGDTVRLTGILNINGVDYLGEILFKNTIEEKRMAIDLKAQRHIHFLAHMKSDYSDISLDFFWDKDKDLNKSISFKASASNGSFIAEIEVLGQQGRITGSFTISSLYGYISWEAYNGTLELKFNPSVSNFEVLAAFKSSIPVLSEIRTHVMLTSVTSITGKSYESKEYNQSLT